MITIRSDGVKELDIFRNFKKDHELPKYNKKEKESGYTPLVIQSGTSTSIGSTSFFSSGGNAISIIANTNGNGNTASPLKKSILDKFIGFIKSIFSKRKVGVQETYKVIFKNLKELEAFNDVSSKLQGELSKAKRLNQTALYEKINDHIKIKMYENQLVALKRLKYISEDKLIEFSEKCERGLRLDWVSNFSRIIPEEVYNEKLEMDGYNIFDNYVIFHYDPEGKSTQLTKEEIAKKRDPIMFGVIEDSKNLYYIGDWVDEYCDLTFDKLMGKFSKEKLKLKAHTK